VEQGTLEQLRNIHLPPEPNWWPPAPGWWVLGIIVAAAVLLILHILKKRENRLLPYKSAESLLKTLRQKLDNNTINELEYANQCNAVIKRILVHVKKDKVAISAQGHAWLQLLDKISSSDQFTNGPGKILGDARFKKENSLQAEDLNHLLLNLLKQLKRSND
tara:strand:+ start:843 stop:1328 length:486 start_codon:yes stop_codon:yes gene_type:complete